MGCITTLFNLLMSIITLGHWNSEERPVISSDSVTMTKVPRDSVVDHYRSKK